MLKWDGNGTDYNVTYQGKTIYFYYDKNTDNGILTVICLDDVL
ncbi:hypothetical protein [Lebetimonas sp. JH292]|nr:hypothetical protein [Lebetimonas sp. JH292]